MNPNALRAFLALALAGAAARQSLIAGQIDAPVYGEFGPGARTGAVGSSLGAPTPLQLTVPALTNTNAPDLASTLTPAPGLLQPVIVQPLTLTPKSVAIGPVASGRTNSTIAPVKPIALAGAIKSAANTPNPEPGTFTDEGRAMFDQGGAHSIEAAATPVGLWSTVKNLLSIGEKVPAWPGKAGDVVRVGGIKTILAEPAGDGGTSKVWRSNNGMFAIKLLHPEALTIPGVREEASTLRAIAGSGLPVAALIAESRDGRVLVKEFINGGTAHEILERGAFSRSQAMNWPELAAKLIKAGVTADLATGNLVWQTLGSRWIIVDGGSLKDGSPETVLKQMMEPGLLSRASLDPVAFLAGLRARLGPDSELWARTLAGLRRSANSASAVAALAKRDAASAAGPVPVFGPAAKSPAGLDDTIVSAKEAAKRLGYDPMKAEAKYRLHGEDPGKLNTKVLSVEPPGKTPVVVKIAQWAIIRNEVALRRLARRFFGRYVRVPASIAVKDGWDSYMIMERLDAHPSYVRGVFNKEQRVAMALFLHTFGVSDVNPGNVLAPRDGGLPWLIDFEQAFSRAAPVAGRIPDERIALEMPWMSLSSLNRVEDYQPGIRAWRLFLSRPDTREAISSDLVASGFTPAQAAGLLTLFDQNADDLDWTLQNDADFVNYFSERSAAQR